MSFTTSFLWSLIVYLVLTAGSGSILLWSPEELIAGIVIAALIGYATRNIMSERLDYFFNPKRWVLFIIYALGPFFLAMARANLDVAYRVITGKIRPGIVRISPNLTRDESRTLLANSITLTPGTFTLEIDEEGNFYVHWINVPPGKEKPTPEELCGYLPKWARRIGE
ncbi:MAG: monovalent cation/H+ antiporter subunit E [Thermococcus sp.]|uniref:monovalent cation/H+ antiporter subunit E n=1 Tax=Thermococcus sp. TaxID=35749 RepID=UPI000F156397|nr:monovalent cation/H+ antiporter subunit E [Thermococcus sp.]RLF76979.1 MAG: cation:proton antiporter [Thermococci archaeon]MCD6139537.1 monovalent cation/H+ antiporter subunit E [Thermococcus sp.]MCD6143960.1 monovalent cation/H+ antiporter subunit E [Thermococcus sp.]RLF86288.1 MAG: cation:proton antiporter [Thermococci archaeon]RLF86414.1 MAG: cation:proton antiporter [Thermococci archaeon]